MRVRAHLTACSPAVVAGLVALTLSLAGCGATSHAPSGSSSGTVVSAAPTPAAVKPSGTVVRVHLTDTSVTPAGTQVSASVGEPVTFVITAVSAGEIHIHSSPEQMIGYPAGTSAASLTFATPGVIDVESHHLDKLIVQLQVR